MISPDAISISTLKEGKYIDVNNSFYEILGYKEEEVIGKSAIEINTWKHPEQRDQIADLLTTNGSFRNFEADFLTKDGQTKHALVSGSVIDLSGKKYMLSIGRDITDLKNNEIKLKLLNEILASQNREYEIVNERLNKSMALAKKINQELEIAKKKAEESDRLKSAFLANMSHEIRTPMNGILGFSSLLKEMNLNDDERHSYLNIIESNGQRLLGIINDLIDISKIESGQIQVNLTECNVAEQMNELYSLFSLEAKQKGLTLNYNNRQIPEKLFITTDKQKLNAVLINLIKNAIKYTSGGNITFGCQLKGSYIEFYIKDTGIGIPQHRQKAIFDRFVQADIEDREAYEGSGLGLAISKAYVEMLSGKIWVESTEGRGSTFFFKIPFNSQTEAAPTPKQEVAAKSKPHKLNIIIAEDEVNSDKLLSILLKEISNKVLHAKTGFEAVELFKKNPDINLILMDIKMPLMDGYEATQAIKKINKNVVVIAQTANALSGDREKALNSGCDDYIAKPINKAELIAIINREFS